MPPAHAFPLPHVEAALPPLGVRTGEFAWAGLPTCTRGNEVIL